VDHITRASFAHLRALSEVLTELCSAGTHDEVIRLGAIHARRLCEVDGVSLVLSSGEQCHDLAGTVPRPEYATFHARMLAGLLEWVADLDGLP